MDEEEALGARMSDVLIPGLADLDGVAVLCLLHPYILPTTKCCFAAPSQKLRRAIIKSGLESENPLQRILAMRSFLHKGEMIISFYSFAFISRNA